MNDERSTRPPDDSGGCRFPGLSPDHPRLVEEIERRLQQHRADEVGAWYESALGAARASLGAFYTPPAVVEAVLDVALGPRPGPQRVCDPACGSGRFLVAAARRMARAGLSVRRAARLVTGVDADPGAVLIARAALRELGLSGADAERAVLCADTLTDPRVIDRMAGSFDALVGNAPFIDSTRSQREQPGRRAVLRGLYESARGNFDLSTLFVEAGLRLVRQGGVVAIITPSRIISSDAATALQRLALARQIAGYLHLGGGRFDAGVETGVLVLRRTATAAPDDRAVPCWCLEGDAVVVRCRTTMGMLRRMPPGYLRGAWDPDAGDLFDRLSTGVTVGELAYVSDGSTTAEAYQLAGLLRECPGTMPSPNFLRVVNSGLIDPGRLLWGERLMRFLGRSFRRPVVERAALERAQPARARQAMTWKVGVAGLAGRIEAAVCPPGVLCAKSVVVVTPREGVLPALLADRLNDGQATRLYRAIFGGRGFSPRSMAIGARQLERLPLADGQLDLAAADASLREASSAESCVTRRGRG